MSYKSVELHSHTNHSDGSYAVETLVEKALNQQYDVLFITDHNTQSAVTQGKQLVENRDLVVLNGIEWTTFYGHMLILMSDEVLDWRIYGKDNLDDALIKIKEHHGIVGIAHPFAVGSPICTGCRWLFKVNRWDLVDFIEIWNSHSPQHTLASEKAYLLWRKLLEAGYRISCSAGRDWHRDEPEGVLIGRVMLELDDKKDDMQIRTSLETGRSYITLQPTLQWTLTQSNHTYRIGDECKAGISLIKILIDLQDDSIIDIDHYEIYNNQHMIETGTINAGEMLEKEISIASGFVRLEVYGWVEQKLCRIIISNPIYIV